MKYHQLAGGKTRTTVKDIARGIIGYIFFVLPSNFIDTIRDYILTGTTVRSRTKELIRKEGLDG